MAGRSLPRGWRIVVGVGVLVAVVAIAVVVVRLAGSGGDARPAATRDGASPTAPAPTAPARAAPASETTEPIDGYARAPDPCALVPDTVARRHVPDAAPLPNPNPPRDPLAVRTCAWKATRVLRMGERPGEQMRSQPLRLSIKAEARPSPALAEGRYRSLVRDMEEVAADQELVEERAVDGMGEQAHLQTVINGGGTDLAETVSSLLVRERNLLLLVTFSGSDQRAEIEQIATHAFVGLPRGRPLDPKRTERAARAVADEMVGQLPAPEELAADAGTPAPDTGTILQRLPDPCASISSERIDQLVPAAERFDDEQAPLDLPAMLQPLLTAEDDTCMWSNNPGASPSSGTDASLTVWVAVVTGEGRQAVDGAADLYSRWELADLVSGTVSRYQTRPGLGDAAFVLAGTDPGISDTNTAYVGVRNGNALMAVEYTQIGGAPLEEIEAAAVEIATDVAHQALR